MSCIASKLSFTHREEVNVNDAIGYAGMLRGWITLWQMQLTWLLPMLVVSVAVVTLVGLLVSTFGQELRPGNPRPARAHTTCVIPQRPAAVSHGTSTAMADLYQHSPSVVVPQSSSLVLDQ
jgi:hypothetical protein